MKHSKSSDAQIAYALREAESGTAVADLDPGAAFNAARYVGRAIALGGRYPSTISVVSSATRPVSVVAQVCAIRIQAHSTSHASSDSWSQSIANPNNLAEHVL